ncbi:uncharacterized protein LOC132738466 [Ruditapes philippinarum]|uniref:uncharacterized protein LOC132738466 n=1 Tax=Ruditapes philippinarum TaxID=129788 RepID=UPI00295A7202|nr:uncharacterized protein LOC132738466 [Ruditapes philippinarum]
MMDIDNEMTKLDGTSINMEDLDLAFDQWVHTERRITITHCAPDSLMAEQMNEKDTVYPITRYVRGRVLLLSNASYQALRLLKDLFTQMNYTVRIETGKSEKDIRGIINSEAHNEDNRYVDSFVVIIYGTPDDFEFDYIPTTLNDENAPLLRGKPKLIYVIGDDSIVRQIEEVGKKNQDPDFLSVSTGFNGIMFYIFILCEFAHELSAQNIWKLMLQNASIHRFAASTHYTLKKEFYFFPGLTSSVFPDEIEKMDPEDMQLYTKMLEKGKVKTYNIRLMFVGLYGAGKTSTARCILGQKIDDVTSTDGIDVHTGRCKVDIRRRKWEIYNDTPESLTHRKLKDLHFADETTQEQLPDIKNLEFREPRLQRGTSEDSPSAMEMDEDNDHTSKSHRTRTLSNKRSIDECDDDDLDDDASSLASSSASTSSVTSEFRRMNVRSISSTSYSDDFEIVNDEMGSMKRARQALTADTPNKGTQYQEALVSFWDFAGQFVYYATHQLFFSPRSIYLLVLNMEDDLQKTLNDWYMDIRGEQSIETKGGINFWLRSIFTYAKGSSSGIPPIVIVGTHGDKLKGNDAEKMKKGKAYFRKIRNVFQGSPHLNNIRHEFFLLDNTKQDTELERLKDTILSISETMPYWGELIPAKWLELEQVLDEKRLEGKPFITMKQLVQLDNTLASPLKDKKQLQLFLKAHHDTGSIIHFGDSDKLNKFIILQPQWIINAFRSLIGATDFRTKYGNLQSQWEEFNENGRLTSEFARQIWKLDEENSFLKNSDLLLDVLEKLDIIAMASVLTEDGEAVRKLDFYYVPCMLKEIPPITLLQKQERIGSFSTPVLCLSFCNDFMPPAIFYRVVALCIGKWPIAKNGKKILMYCGCAVFEVNYGKGEDLHRLYLFSKQSKIGLRITRYSSKKAGMVDPNICDRVRRFITSAVKKEFMRFQVEQSSEEARYFSYELQCKETTEDDILDEGLHNEKDLLNAVGTDFFCAEHSDKTDPHSLKPVEMLHEWFNGKIPRGIPLEGPSVFDTWVVRLPEELKQEYITEKTLSRLTNAIGKDWKRLMKVMNVKDVPVEKIEENYPENERYQKFHALRLWKSNKEKDGGRTSNMDLLQDLMKAAKEGIDIDFEEVQNVFDEI